MVYLLGFKERGFSSSGPHLCEMDLVFVQAGHDRPCFATTWTLGHTIIRSFTRSSRAGVHFAYLGSEHASCCRRGCECHWRKQSMRGFQWGWSSFAGKNPFQWKDGRIRSCWRWFSIKLVLFMAHLLKLLLIEWLMQVREACTEALKERVRNANGADNMSKAADIKSKLTVTSRHFEIALTRVFPSVSATVRF